jgi:alpha-tubulin suppressor-like RCC1 family protein
VQVSSPWYDTAGVDALGVTGRFAAQAIDTDGNVTDTLPTLWSSSAPSVVSIDSHGDAHTLDNGASYIVATIGGKADSVRVKVAQAGLFGVGPAAGSILIGDTIRVFAEGTDKNGNPLRNVIFTAPGAPAIAQFDPATRLVRGLSAGQFEMYASNRSEGASFGVYVLPADVRAPYTFREVAVGSASVCAIDITGAIWCWGNNIGGALGIGSTDTATRTRPQQVNDGRQYVAIDGGGFWLFASSEIVGGYNCGVTSSHQVYCWGSLYQTVASTTPVLSSDTISVSAVSVGTTQACVLSSAGGLYCWGSDRFGQPTNTTPARKAENLTFASVSVGDQSACAVTVDGHLYCWGDNTYAQLGQGVADTTNHTIPTEVPLNGTVAAAAVGQTYACAIIQGGETFCWGQQNRNYESQRPPIVLRPTTLAGALRFASLSLGENEYCGVTLDSDTYCWGLKYASGSGVAGSKPFESPSIFTAPVRVYGNLKSRRVSTTLNGGGGTTCAESFDDRVYCWGDGWHGELGIGLIWNSNIPVRVSRSM